MRKYKTPNAAQQTKLILTFVQSLNAIHLCFKNEEVFVKSILNRIKSACESKMEIKQEDRE